MRNLHYSIKNENEVYRRYYKKLKNQTVNAALIEGIQLPIKFHWTSLPWQELILNDNTTITYYYSDQLISTRLLLHF